MKMVCHYIRMKNGQWLKCTHLSLSVIKQGLVLTTLATFRVRYSETHSGYALLRVHTHYVYITHDPCGQSAKRESGLTEHSLQGQILANYFQTNFLSSQSKTNEVSSAVPRKLPSPPGMCYCLLTLLVSSLLNRSNPQFRVELLWRSFVYIRPLSLI
jgi:hypothetical protein